MEYFTVFFLFYQLFLWIGKSSNEYERNESLTSAKEYLKSHPAGRDLSTPIITVKQGHEPPTFTGWFDAWDSHKWSVSNLICPISVLYIIISEEVTQHIKIHNDIIKEYINWCWRFKCPNGLLNLLGNSVWISVHCSFQVCTPFLAITPGFHYSCSIF